MRRTWIALATLAIAARGVSAQTTTTQEIDRQVWSVVSETVARDDMEGMGRTYHPAAVVVTPRGTTPVAAQLKQWAQDAMASKARGTKATVEFRFTRRQDDATSAFETGMFKYTQTDKNGVAKPVFVPMECLLVKDGGRWVILMERQLDASTEAAWNALAR